MLNSGKWLHQIERATVCSHASKVSSNERSLINERAIFLTHLYFFKGLVYPHYDNRLHFIKICFLIPPTFTLPKPCPFKSRLVPSSLTVVAVPYSSQWELVVSVREGSFSIIFNKSWITEFPVRILQYMD